MDYPSNCSLNSAFVILYLSNCKTYLQFGGKASKYLMAVHVPAVSTEECQKAYDVKITKNMVCAGWPEGGKSVCGVCNSRTYFILITVVVSNNYERKKKKQ
jgi:hypothetical protein